MTAPLTLETALSALDHVDQASSDYDLNLDVVLPEGRKLRPAGVLVLLAEQDGIWQVCLTKRSSALKHHPGQVAFPGGKQDEDDEDIRATALREAREEIGLPAGHARIVGQLPVHETVTSFAVTPVVAVLEQPFALTPEPGEVAEVFFAPLAHVLDPDAYRIQSRIWQRRTRAYFAVPFGPYYIWGATARMLKGWADAVGRQ